MRFLTKSLKKVFNRPVICIIGIIIQISYLIMVFLTFGTLYSYSFFIFLGIGAALSLYICNQDINPSYKISWIFVILSFPLFGVMFYVFFGNNHSGDRLRKRMMRFHDESKLLLSQNEQLLKQLHSTFPAAEKQARYLYDYSGCPVYSDTDVTYFGTGEELFSAMLAELKKAERYIFLEYFIISDGEMWRTILEILEEKAKQGIDIRLVYDDIGCLLTLPYKYNQAMESKGIKCRVFNPFRPVWSAKINNRDHRKLLIIDGHTAFTGGINLADEYINKVQKYGHWKDSAIMLKGHGVWSFTVMFMTMWSYLEQNTNENALAFFPQEKYIRHSSNAGVVIPFTDSPLDDEPVGENVYLNIINSAKDYVYITTPYLVIDNEMQTALVLAAKSGVDIRIITPHIPDKWFVFAVTRANYRKLLKNGIKIYEYTPGFIHAKNFISDDNSAVIGTINLDFRSLYLHLECAVCMYNCKCISDIKADYIDTLSKCQEITYSDCIHISFFRRLMRAFLRLFAPLM